MSNEDIFFYVVVPIYNVERYLVRCVESLLNQTYKLFHVVFVDDCSQDNSGKICDQYALNNDNFSVIHKSKNEGLFCARQTGIDFIKNSFHLNQNAYVLSLDSDDSFKIDALEIIAKRIKESDCDLLMFQLKVITPNSTTEIKREENDFEIICDKRRLLLKVFCHQGYNSLCTKAIHISLLSKQYEKRRINYAEDLYQSIDIYSQAKKVCLTNDYLYNYYTNPSSITQRITFNNFPMAEDIELEIYNFLKEQSCFTPNDMALFLNFRSEILINTLYILKKSKISRKNKKEIFNRIFNSPFYSILYNTNSSHYFPFKTLKKHQMDLTFTLVFFWKVKSKIKKIFKRK